MKMRLLIFAIVSVLPGGLWASSVSCGFNLVSLQSSGCVSQSSFNFNDSMLWTAAGYAYEGPGQPNGEPPDGSVLNPANSASYTGVSAGGGVSVIATTAAGGTGTLLGRYDEAPWVWAGTTLGWVQPGVSNCTSLTYNNGVPTCTSSASTPYLLTYQGPFYFDTSTATVYGNGSLDANTALLGTTNGTGPIQLSFSQSLTAFGVDISALNATSFTASLQAYDGNSLLGTYYIDAIGYGGTCTMLDIMPSAGGSGCNNAPFIGIGNLGPITKVILGVTDDSSGGAAGFAIDTLQLGGAPIATPEPGALLLAACGLGTLIWRSRNSSSEYR